MARIAVTEARSRLAQLVELAATEAVHIERYGRPAAVLISPERFERLMDALEELEDLEAFDLALAECGPNVPWEQLKA